MSMFKEDAALPTNKNILFFISLVVGNLLMFAPEGGVLRTVGALIILLLPGLVWIDVFRLTSNYLWKIAIGFGLSYTLLITLGTVLHFIPGSISFWTVLVLFNILTLIAIVICFFAQRADEQTQPVWKSRTAMFVLLAILAYGAIFRFVNLGYSEFDGDETKALIPAAGAIEGQFDALFIQRKKGPGEIMIPMAVWRLTGLVNEFNVRLPFAIAGLLTILTTYLVGKAFFSERVGLISAGLIALNGLLVAFSRIVQYQQIVVWMSLLSLLCVWQWRRDGKVGWHVLAGLFLGVGVLSHYDTLLVGPPLAYIVVVSGKGIRSIVKAMAASSAMFIATISLFLVPYLANPQVTQTGEYLEQRIGAGLLKNQLFNFFHINIFYNSFYYVLVVGLLALGFLVWAIIRLKWIKRHPFAKYLVLGVVVAAVLALSLRPQTLSFGTVDVALLVFGLIFLGAFLSPAVALSQRVMIIWLAVSFLGYSFFVVSPRTHFYTILPALIFLAALSADWLWEKLAIAAGRQLLPAAVAGVLALLFGGYLVQAYLRTDVQFEIDWPESQLALYWSPYSEAPRYDAYGFTHRSGWKSIGGLYIAGKLSGNYQTNGLYELADWYTRHQLQGCYRQSGNFFAVKHKLFNPNELKTYTLTGEVDLPNHKGINIYQSSPAVDDLGAVNVGELRNIFDSTAQPISFVRPKTIQQDTNVNLADAIKLTGYTISNPQVSSGEQIGVVLNWKTLKDIPVDLDVFVHLEGEGNVWGQSNGSPACGEQPTSTWVPNTTITDLHILEFDANTPPGKYKIVVGMYLPGENIRVPVFDETGNAVAESIELTMVNIESKVE